MALPVVVEGAPEEIYSLTSCVGTLRKLSQRRVISGKELIRSMEESKDRPRQI